MPAVPLALQAYKRSSGYVPEAKCLNMFLEKDESGISPDGMLRLQRPGLLAFQTVDSPVRQVTFDPSNSYTYIVAGSSFYRAATGFLSNEGSVGSGGDARIVPTALATGILSGGNFYLYTAGPPVMVAVPDGATVVDIDQINGYFLLLLQTGRFYWIVPGESTIDPLNFATAESSNDYAVGIRQIGEEFWIFGAETIEPWQPTGDFDLPFERAQGRVIPHGCLAKNTICRMDNTLFWVGDGKVFRGGAVAQVVSTNGISERIRLSYEGGLVGDISAWTFIMDGHEFYVLRIPGQGTFVNDVTTQTWSQWKTEGDDQWAMWVGDTLGGITHAGEFNGTHVYKVSAAYLTDVGAPFERLITGTLPILGVPPRNDSLSVGVGASADTTVRIRWRDGQDDYPDYYDELEVRAPSDIANLYRLGAPQQPYREVEVSFIGLEGVSVRGCLANEAFQ